MATTARAGSIPPTQLQPRSHRPQGEDPPSASCSPDAPLFDHIPAWPSVLPRRRTPHTHVPECSSTEGPSGSAPQTVRTS
eukprot:6533097-Pyramimonas_sp.AAC.1